MEKAFNSAAARRILVDGLLKPNPANESAFKIRRRQIEELRNNIKYIKSKTTKLV